MQVLDRIDGRQKQVREVREKKSQNQNEGEPAFEPPAWFQEKLATLQTTVQECRNEQRQQRQKARAEAKAKNGNDEAGDVAKDEEDRDEDEDAGEEADKSELVDSSGSQARSKALESTYKNFQYEDWTLCSMRVELHMLVHAMARREETAGADADSDKVTLQQLPILYRRYFRKQFNTHFFGVESARAVVELVSDAITLSGDDDTAVLEAVLPDDADAAAFLQSTETRRTEREDAIANGDEGAKLHFNPRKKGDKGGKGGSKGEGGNRKGGGQKGNDGGARRQKGGQQGDRSYNQWQNWSEDWSGYGGGSYDGDKNWYGKEGSRGGGRDNWQKRDGEGQGRGKGRGKNGKSWSEKKAPEGGESAAA
jgi:hypothetical protein